MKIVIIGIGIGYVWLSNGIFFAEHNEIVALDISPEKVEMLQKKILPIENQYISEILLRDDLDFRMTLDKNDAYEGTDFVIISTPMNYDIKTNYCNTKSIEYVIA